MSPRRRLFLGVFAAILLSAQDKQPAVQITGAVKQPLNLTAGDLAKMARATVRINTEGTQTVFEGVWLHEVLKKAGAPEGMHGKALAAFIKKRFDVSLTVRQCRRIVKQFLCS